MYYHDSNISERTTLINISIGITFMKFCGIVIWSIVQAFSHFIHCQRQEIQVEPDENTQLFHEREIIEDNDNDNQFRDSIQNDSQIRPTY